jgi:hypothetical protein
MIMESQQLDGRTLGSITRAAGTLRGAREGGCVGH